MAIQTTLTPTPTPTPTPAADATLAGTGFKLADDRVKRRLIMSVEGDWGTGKTDFALTAPGPIAFFKIDPNSDVTVAKYANKKRILKNEIVVPSSDQPDAQAKAEAVWRKFRADYDWALNHDIRSIIWDTASEIWELCRLAAFGKLTNVMPHHYVAVNNDFRRLIKDAFDSDTNLIMIHKVKDEWVNYTDTQGKEKGKRTGKKERAGFSDIGFACQVMVQTTFDRDREESPFQAQVLKCTQNPMITGTVYGQMGDMRGNSFPVIATDVFPDSSIDDWA